MGGAVKDFIHCEMHNPFVVVEPEAIKTVCQEMLLDANVTVILDTLVVDVIGTTEKIEALIIEGKSGRQAITSKTFIDATGDADLVARAGAPYFIADIDKLQANTLGVILTNVNKRKFKEHLLAYPEKYDLYPLLSREQISNSDYFIISGLTKIIQKASKEKNFKNIYGMSNFTTLPREDAIYINSIHVSGFNPCDTIELSLLEIEGRKQIQQVVDFMRKYIPGFENAKVSTTGPWIGVRESRIIDGIKQLTLNHIKNGEIPEDTIALGGYPYDFHQKDTDDNKVHFYKIPPYGIPYGCLIPKNTSNLFVAGKTISATREAMCSSRVMAQCMAEGQAAGIAAAICAAQHLKSTELKVSLLREELIKNDAKLA